METTLAQRWDLARATVGQLRGWQPDAEPECVLEAVEAVAVGREGEPGVLWSWRQGDARYQATVTVLDLIEAADYDEWLEPPEAPEPGDWTSLLRLTVYEPQGRPDGAGLDVRWCFDSLP